MKTLPSRLPPVKITRPGMRGVMRGNSMRVPALVLALAFAFVLAMGAGTLRASPVVYQTFRVPTGIYLGQSAGAVASILERGSGKVVARETEGNRMVWTLEDLFIRNFQSGKLTFQNGELIEIEFRYGRPEWSQDRLRRLMRDYKILLEHQLGFPDDQHREVSSMGPIIESTEAYMWYLADSAVHLVLYTAAQGTNEHTVFSAHIGRKLATPGQVGAPADAPLPDVEAAGDGMMLFADDPPDLPAAAEAIDMPEEPLPGELFSNEALMSDELPGETAESEDAASEEPAVDPVEEEGAEADALVEVDVEVEGTADEAERDADTDAPAPEDLTPEPREETAPAETDEAPSVPGNS